MSGGERAYVGAVVQDELERVDDAKRTAVDRFSGPQAARVLAKSGRPT